MKASEFVKKFGLDAAKDILENRRSWIDKKSGRKLTDNSFVLKSKTYEYAIGTLYMGNFSDYDENSYRVDEVNLLLLKRLVESHELVEIYTRRFNGDAEWFFVSEYCKKNRISPFFSENYNKASGIYKQAIADVESCQ